MTAFIKVLLAPENPSRETLLRNGLAAYEDVSIVKVYSRWKGEDYASFLAGLNPDIFLIDTLSCDPAFLKLARYHAEVFPYAATVFLTAVDDPGFTKQAQQAGTRAVFNDPLDFAKLYQLMAAAFQDGVARKLAPESPKRVPLAQVSTNPVFALVSAKDGEGKTTIAVNLAAILSLRYNRRVALIDLNTNFDDFTVLMNRRSPKHLLDALQLVTTKQSAQQIRSCFADLKGDGRLRYLCGPCSIRPVPLDQGQIIELIRITASESDIVVLDTPVLLNEALAAALAVADSYHVVIQSHVASLRNAKAYVNALVRAGYPASKVRVILNRVSSTVGLSIQELEHFIEPYPVAGRIVSAGRLVIDALNEGVPFAISQPKADVTSSLDLLASNLIGQ